MQIIISNMLSNWKQFLCHSFVLPSKSIFRDWVFIFCSSTHTWSRRSYQWALSLETVACFFSHRTEVAFVVGVGGGCTKVLKEYSLRIPFSLGCCCSSWPRNSSWFLFGACWQRLVRGITLELNWRISVKNVSCTFSLPFPIFMRSNCKDYKYFLVQVTF